MFGIRKPQSGLLGMLDGIRAPAGSPIEGLLSMFGVPTSYERQQLAQQQALQSALFGSPAALQPNVTTGEGAGGVWTNPDTQEKVWQGGGLMNGRPMQDLQLAAMAPEAVAQGMLAQRFAPPKDPVALAKGAKLVDPSTGKVIAEGAPEDKRTELQRNFEAAAAQGFKGNIFDYQRALAEAGRAPGQPPAPRNVQTVTTDKGIFVLNPDGTLGNKLGDPTGRDRNMSPTEQRQLFDSQDAVQAGDLAIQSIERALGLNNQAASGPFATVQQYGNRVFNKDAAAATSQFNTEVLEQALGQLKTMFGAAPTEGERAILLEMQAAPTMTRTEREALLQRGLALAKRRRDFEAARIEQIMTGGSSRRTDATPAPTAPAPAATPPAATNPAQMSDEELIRRVLGGK